MNNEKLKNLTDEMNKLSQERKWGAVIAKCEEISDLLPGDADKAEAKSHFLHIRDLALIMEAAEKRIPYQSVPATQPLQLTETTIAPSSHPNFTYYTVHQKEGGKFKMWMVLGVAVSVTISIAIIATVALLLYYFSDWKEFITFSQEMADLWVKLKHPPSSP